MKKLLHPLIFLLFFTPVISYSQLDGSGIAPNFTLTDTSGVSHTLYDYLDNGKVVVLDFFATWCGPCNNNADEVERVWQDYGPDGDNTIMMFLMESSSTSNFSDLQGFMSQHNVTCPTFDQCETTDVPSDYEVGYFPTYYIVYSDRSYQQVSGGPDEIYQVMVDAIGENPGLSTTTYDAKILEFNDPIGSFCTDSIRPKVTLQNYGTETLTSVDIKSIIDGNVTDTYSWTGSLAQYEIEEIELVDITNIAAGDHTFTFTAENPNGQTDVESSNDSKDSPFKIINDGAIITVDITTDSYPTETSWELLDDDEVFTSGGKFSSANTKYTEQVCVYSDSCYTFTIYDSYGDGNSSQPVEISLNGYTLGSITGFSTGYSASVEFCAVIPAPVVTISPADGSTEIVRDDDLTLTFDMPVRLLNDDEITDPASIIILKKSDSSGDDVSFTASINNDNTIITINPDEVLDANQDYYLGIEAVVENEYDIPLEPTSSTFTTGTVTGIEFDASIYELSVYPNPFKNQLNISFTNQGSCNPVVEIYNQTGMLVKKIRLEDKPGNNVYNINTENMPNGIYFMNLNLEGNNISKKIVLIR